MVHPIIKRITHVTWANAMAICNWPIKAALFRCHSISQQPKYLGLRFILSISIMGWNDCLLFHKPHLTFTFFHFYSSWHQIRNKIQSWSNIDSMSVFLKGNLELWSKIVCVCVMQHSICNQNRTIFPVMNSDFWFSSSDICCFASLRCYEINRQLIGGCLLLIVIAQQLFFKGFTL